MRRRRSVSVVVAASGPLGRTLHAALEAEGHTVAETCAELAGALEAIRRSRPDVCIVDRELHGGLAAIAALAGHGRRPKVIVVGGAESAAELRAARLAGASDVVPEPVDPGRLAAAVAAAAGSITR